MRKMMSLTKTPATERFALLILFAFSLLVAFYFPMRYAGKRTGGDTIRMAVATSNVLQQGTLQPEGEVYPHGFNSPAVSAILVNVTGAPLELLNQFVLPFLLAVNVLVAYVAFRFLTQEKWAALLGAFLLAMQAEFVFTVVRGTHEKLTWMMVLLAILVLAKSFVNVGRPRRFVIWVGLFYLFAFAIIASNSFFASSFLTALATCFIAAAAITYVGLKRDNDFSRLVYVTVACSILVFLFRFYIYTPALRVTSALKLNIDRIAALFLNTDVVFDPSAAGGHVGTGWVSGMTYVALSSASWTLVLTSGVYWLVMTRRVLRARHRGSPLMLLWLFYAAFAVQFALSVGASGLGLLASNLQVRLFPVFMLLAIPLAALAVQSAVRSTAKTRLRPIVLLLVLLFSAWMAGSAILKATNEPLLSNYWVFKLRSEENALRWTQLYTRYGRVWIGLDRLRYVSEDYDDPLRNRYDIYAVGEFVRYALVSDFSETRMLRMGVEQPALGLENQVYENGTARMYHLRPRTPFQR